MVSKRLFQRWFFVGYFLVVWACSDTASGRKTNNDGSSDDDRRLADITDEEIVEICNGKETSCEKPPTGSAQPGKVDDCEQQLGVLRDKGSCVRLGDARDWWQAGSCEAFPVCPEREACANYSLDECESEGEESCVLVEARYFNPDGDCALIAPVLCVPRGSCTGDGFQADDPSGKCWEFASGCGLPDGWTAGDPTCMDPDAPLCSEVEGCQGASCGQPCDSVVDCEGEQPMACAPVAGAQENVCDAAWLCSGLSSRYDADDCSISWGECRIEEGEETREIQCRLEDNIANCVCVEGGVEVQTFEMPAMLCTTASLKAADAINEACGWKIELRG